MRLVRMRRAAALLAVGVAMSATGGCRQWRGGEAAAPVRLVVRNHGLHYVAVDLVRPDSAPGRCLGTVAGYAVVPLRLERRELQPGGMLVVRVRAIGTRHVWVSPGVAVPTGVTAYLDVSTGADGDLRGSSLGTTSSTTAAWSRGVGAHARCA